jgi:hypothetical protein
MLPAPDLLDLPEVLGTPAEQDLMQALLFVPPRLRDGGFGFGSSMASRSMREIMTSFPCADGS